MPDELKRKERTESYSQNKAQQPAKRSCKMTQEPTVCAHKELTRNLMHNTKYSDLTIVCRSESFAVHRCIVCSQSDFMAAACDGQFREASSRRIELNDVEPEIVKRMLEYIYTLDYGVGSFDGCLTETPPGEAGANGSRAVPSNPDERSPLSELTPDSLLLHVHMYLLADRFIVHGLKQVAANKLTAQFWQPVDARSFRQTVLGIYQSTPPHGTWLKYFIVEMTLARLTEFRQRSGTDPIVLPDTLLAEVPNFATDLSISMMNNCVSLWDKGEPCYKNWNKVAPEAVIPNRGSIVHKSTNNGGMAKQRPSRATLPSHP